MIPLHGRRRVVIEDVTPQQDGGRYAVRRIAGDEVVVTAAIFADGKDELAARAHYRHSSDGRWRFVPMLPTGNDLWKGIIRVDALGALRFTFLGWVDHFAGWAGDLKKRLAAQRDPSLSTALPAAAPNHGAGLNIGSNPQSRDTQSDDIALALRSGAVLVREASRRAKGGDARLLEQWAQRFEDLAKEQRATYDNPLDDALIELMARYPDLAKATNYDAELPIWVDCERARFSSWYELFPRSASPVPGEHGTFRDVERQLPEIAEMGFDILYLPPIHPIGRAFRKGPNNSISAPPGAPGSPWAIGDRAVKVSAALGAQFAGDQGGHKSIHPELGTFAGFESLTTTARSRGIEVALDIAFQCSPDHPWVSEHPDWFVKRPDDSIQYAENPPKKYQDIYPLNFESSVWRGLWHELYSVFEFWIARGVRVFRVDNPQLICYSKATPDFENTILVVVNLDSFNEQSGWTNLDLDKIGCGAYESFLVDDLLSGEHYVWRGRSYVSLHPGVKPAHIFRVSRIQ